MSYRAVVTEDWVRRAVRLHVMRRAGDREQILMADGRWKNYDSTTVLPDDAGVELPVAAAEAVAAAWAKHMGDALPSAAEVRVLREWLSKESGRVDALLRCESGG